ncbi:MAG: type II toxin-antitoxin system VapC family toxin [Anaerolineales bacterium]|nr:type II toxin-antitoxin system VapC family toxin [Anaerolineales bacterium]
MIQQCVVDASVGIKLFVKEPDSALADQLFSALTESDTRFYVPDLFFVECGNILWKYVRHFGYEAGLARQDVKDMLQLALHVVSTADLLLPAFELAVQYDLTAYDACYVALAQQLHLPLVTADTPLVKKLQGSNLDVRSLAALA